MGKFDSLEKYLGKEDLYTPAEINSALENIDVQSVDIDMDDDIDPDALANIDDLLTIAGDAGMEEIVAVPEEEEDISLSGRELDAIGVEDTGVEGTPSQELDLSEFSALSMDSDEEAAADLASLADLNAQSDSVAEDLDTDTSFEMPDTGFEIPETVEAVDPGEAGIDFSAQDDSPPEAPDEGTEGIDPEVLDELQNLDSAPPSIADIATRRYSEDLSESEEVSDIEADLAAMANQEVEYTQEEPEGAPLQMDDMDIDISDGSEQGEFGDLLSQLSPGEENTGSETELMPEIGQEMDELSDILATVQDESPIEETAASETDSVLDELSGFSLETPDGGETPATEETGGFELEGGGFEMPDFGMEESEDLKTEGGEPDLSDFMAEMGGDEDATDLGLESGSEMDFELPADGDTVSGDEAFPDLNIESGDGEELDLSSFGDVSSEAFSEDSGSDFEGLEGGEEPGGFDFPDTDTEFEMPAIDESGGELDIDAFSDVDDESQFTPLDAGEAVSGGPSVPDGFNMDEDKALRIRNRINQLTDPSLRKLLRNAFLDPIASPDQIEKLMAMLLLNEDEEKIYNFIEKNIPSLLDTMAAEPDDLEIRPDVPESRPRRVIYAEDAKKAQQFQQEFRTYARYASFVLISVVLLAFIVFRFIWAPNRASFHYKRGLQSIKVGSYNNAEAKFMEGENVGGFDPKWYNRFAEAYLQKNEIVLATNKFDAVLSRKPLHKETIYNFGQFYEDIYPPRFDRAIALYERLLKRDSEDFEIIDMIGQAYINWGDFLSEKDEKEQKYDAASEMYKAYAGKETKHIPSRFKLLLAALRVGNHDQIESWYKEINELNKGAIHLEILTDLAQYHIDRRDMESAKEVLEKLQSYIDGDLSKKEKGSLGLKKELAVSDTWYQFARYYTINMDYVKALNTSSNAILWNSKNGLAYNLMGEIYYLNVNLTNFSSIGITNRSSTKIAEEFFKLSAKNSTGYYKPYANLGHIYYYQRNFNITNDTPFMHLVTNYYYTAKNLLPENIKDDKLRYNLAWVNYKIGNYDNALDEWSELYIDDPFNPILSFAVGNTYFYQAQILLRQGKVKQAQDRMKHAVVQYDKAIEYYESIAKKVRYINPLLERHQEIYMQLARSYNNRGVIHSMFSRMSKKRKADYEQQALLDFFKAKDTALKINVDPYGPAEYNIKYTYNKLIKGRSPAFDREVPKRTTLRKLVDEFRFNLIQTI